MSSKSLLSPVLGGREVETGLEVVVEGGGTTETGGSSNVCHFHVGCLQQDAGMLQTAVADEVGHGTVVAALGEGTARLCEGEGHQLHDADRDL